MPAPGMADKDGKALGGAPEADIDAAAARCHVHHHGDIGNACRTKAHTGHDKTDAKQELSRA